MDKKDFEFIGNLIDTPKTGLGSSSALIVCCLGALCGEVDVKLAIRANIIAQGKIGSGFDISTCITGSQIYKRPKYKLEKLSVGWINSIEDLKSKIAGWNIINNCGLKSRIKYDSKREKFHKVSNRKPTIK